jgi:hypothetical protein
MIYSRSVQRLYGRAWLVCGWTGKYVQAIALDFTGRGAGIVYRNHRLILGAETVDGHGRKKGAVVYGDMRLFRRASEGDVYVECAPYHGAFFR